MAKENQHERFERLPSRPEPAFSASAPKQPTLPAKSTARMKKQDAKEVAERRSEEAFQTWWRENRALRVSQSSPSVSGKDRLAAVHARFAAKRT